MIQNRDKLNQTEVKQSNKQNENIKNKIVIVTKLNCSPIKTLRINQASLTTNFFEENDKVDSPNQKVRSFTVKNSLSNS